MLVSRYVVNQGYFGGDSDLIDHETALPVLVSGCEVTSEVTVIRLIVKLLLSACVRLRSESSLLCS